MVYRLLHKTLPVAALLLLIGGPASALNLSFGSGEDSATAPAASPSPSQPLPQQRAKQPERPILLSQMSDPVVRINQLEEEVRKLNGKVEELSFQLLQMQEQMRKQQEDNEFRFQELEGGGQTGQQQPSGSGQTGSLEPSSQPMDSDGPAVAETAPEPQASEPTTPSGPVRTVLGSGLDDSSLENLGNQNGGASDTVASIDPKDAGDLYDLAYNYLLSGDYKLAEEAFRQYAQTYPDAKDASDAQYWLGESLFAQGEYTDAAEVFLNAQKAHPDSRKAPEMLLKLGMSLARLDNPDTACVTYSEVSRRYPNVSDNVRQKLKDEQKAASCADRG
ncbi:tol-pal system protein YbgF [Consotaella aegiceratis]|uniref:tol-pal system protein YbgF n=1 Tax=Consotaella aegiceratis TaxID=3097961 RepID=UPI002F40F366